MTRLDLRLLGRFRLSRDRDGEIPITSRKAQALLAYLALCAGRRETREKLAALLWSDRGEEQARHSLRQAVLTLRKAGGEGASERPVVHAEGDFLCLDPEVVSVDASAFERNAAAGGTAALEQALAFYGGELLEGIGVRSEGFEDWLAIERTRLARIAGDTLAALMKSYAEAGQADAAQAAAERLVALDPLREDGHRMLMHLHDAAGRRAAALRQYRTCAEILQRELDTGPEPETQWLLEQIRGREDFIDTAPAAAEITEPVPPLGPSPAPTRRRWWPLAAASAVALVLVAGGIMWFVAAPESIRRPGAPSERFPLPEKPSIAVLPFQNISGDPAQDDFIDGITEGITTELSIISEMFVIARNSTLVYKDRTKRVQDVARELGVRYILDGSVQRADDRVRISTQLINAADGTHLWAERYDRQVTDVFALQDNITLEVITALQVELTEGEQERRSLSHGTRNLQAWVTAGRALKHLRRLTREDNALARKLYEDAIALDASYPGAWGGLAWTHFTDAFFGWSGAPEESLQRANELAQKALALDPSRPRTYALLGSIALMGRQHEEAIAFGRKAVELNPNGADVCALLALTMSYTGHPDESIALLNRAMRLSPYYPLWYQWTLGRAYRLAGRHDEAIAAYRASLQRDAGSFLPHVELAVTYMELGRHRESRAAAQEVLRLNPHFSIRAWAGTLPYSDAAILRRELAYLASAGLPE